MSGEGAQARIYRVWAKTDQAAQATGAFVIATHVMKTLSNKAY